MLKLLLPLVFLNITFFSAHSQYTYISFTNTPLEFLSEIDDTSLNKFVDKIYLYAEIKDGTKKSFLQDVTDSLNKIIKIPDSIKNLARINQKLFLTLKGYLYEFFSNDPIKNKDINVDEFNFSVKEKQILQKLKSFGFLNEKVEKSLSQIITITGFDGKNRLEYFETPTIIFNSYYSLNYNKIECRIDYSPIYADIYIVAKKDWVYTFNLSDPPVENEITKSVLQKLSNYKITQGPSPLKIELNEKSYIIIYDKKGAISFDHIDPSTIYKTQNNIRSKLN